MGKFEFEGKLAAITGSASGIGRAVALAMARLGTNIVLVDRDNEGLDKVKREIENLGIKVTSYVCDITDNSCIVNMADQTIKNLGVPDILVNSAGIGAYGDVEKVKVLDYEKVLDINLLGAIRVVLAFWKPMMERGNGYIVNVASRAGFFCILPPYALSKYALVGYSEALYCHVRPKGIMVSALCPAMVNTNLPLNAICHVDDKDLMETRLKVQEELGFTGPDSMDPDDVAQILLEGMEEGRFLILTPHSEQFIDEAMRRGKDIYKLETYLQENVNNAFVPMKDESFLKK